MSAERKGLLPAVVVLAAAGACTSARVHGGVASYRYKVAYATYVGGSADEQFREVIPAADGLVLGDGCARHPGA